MVTARNVLDAVTSHDVSSPASARSALLAERAVVGAFEEVGAVRRVPKNTIRMALAEVL